MKFHYEHDNKICITNKIIKFYYNYNYNKNISIYYKERITELFIDIKTGQSKLLIIKDNINKNNIKSLIRDCTYANNIFNYAVDLDMMSNNPLLTFKFKKNTKIINPD